MHPTDGGGPLSAPEERVTAYAYNISFRVRCCLRDLNPLSNPIESVGDRESIRSPANIVTVHSYGTQNGPGTSIRPAARTASTHLWNLHDANRFDLPLSTFSTAFKTRHEGDTTIVYVIRSARARPLWRPEPEAGHRSQHRKSLCMPN